MGYPGQGRTAAVVRRSMRPAAVQDPATDQPHGSALTFVLVLLGVLVLQALWSASVPPFWAIDEHDHAFKAAAVAHGDFSRTHERVEVGRGELVAVPRDIVEAALPACETLIYTERDDCHPSADLADGRVLVGSAAARYNPFVYAVVGTAARPFDGVTALYVMRFVAGAWCAVLVALAFVVARRGSRTAWPAITLLAALTPTTLYSTSVAAPNGVEMASGLLLWCVLVFGGRTGGRVPTWVVAAGTVAAVSLALARSFGPLWLVAVVVTAAIAHGVPSFLSAARAPRLRLPIVLSVLAVAAGLWWSLTSGTNSPASESGPTFPGSPWPRLPTNWLVWVLQLVAAIPRRGDMVPVLVYGIGLIVWIMLLAVTLVRASGRVRLAILLLFAGVTGFSVLVTLVTYTELGYAWQGRYAWPYVVGWLVLAGATLDTAGLREVHQRAARTVVVLGIGLMSAIGALGVVSHERTVSPYAGPGWPPSPALIVALCVLGSALLVAAASQPRRDSPVSLRRQDPTT